VDSTAKRLHQCASHPHPHPHAIDIVVAVAVNFCCRSSPVSLNDLSSDPRPLHRQRCEPCQRLVAVAARVQPKRLAQRASEPGDWSHLHQRTLINRRHDSERPMCGVSSCASGVSRWAGWAWRQKNRNQTADCLKPHAPLAAVSCPSLMQGSHGCIGVLRLSVAVAVLSCSVCG